MGQSSNLSSLEQLESEVSAGASEQVCGLVEEAEATVDRFRTVEALYGAAYEKVIALETQVQSIKSNK